MSAERPMRGALLAFREVFLRIPAELLEFGAVAVSTRTPALEGHERHLQ